MTGDSHVSLTRAHMVAIFPPDRAVHPSHPSSHVDPTPSYSHAHVHRLEESDRFYCSPDDVQTACRMSHGLSHGICPAFLYLPALGAHG